MSGTMVAQVMAANATTTGVVTTIAVILVVGAMPPLVPATGHAAPADAGPAVDRQPEYNVTFDSTTIDELVLRNVVVTDVSVRNVTIDEMTVGNETTEDVELENVTLERLRVERAVVGNVSTGELSVRNRSVLNVPGGELIGNVGDRSLDRHVVENLTVSGVEIRQLHLANLTVEAEPGDIEGDVESQSDAEEPEKPAVSIVDAEAETGTVTNASFERGTVEQASVENETVTPDDDSGEKLNARTGR